MCRLNSYLLCLGAILCFVRLSPAQVAGCPTSGNVVVNSAANSGTGTLRWAIECVNSVAALNTIVFNIPAPGVNTISISTPLPPVTKNGAVIDGTINESVIISGSPNLVRSNGLVIVGNNVTVRGVRVASFNNPDPNGIGILLAGNNAKIENNFIYDNRLGIVVRDPFATTAPNPVQNASITGNTIGLTFAVAEAGNSSHAILFENTANGAIISDNTIAYNGGNGVRLAAAGGTARISQNRMFCNALAGIFRQNSLAAPTITQANTQRIAGTAAAGNLVEVFAHNNDKCSPNTPCQGRVFLGAATANLFGNWTLNLTPGAITPGDLATATRTVGGNNTYGFSSCLIISNCAGVSVSISSSPITCNGGDDGALTAMTAERSPSYLWSTGATTQSIFGLGPGTYSVTITNSAGCTASASATLNNPAPINPNITSTNVRCFGEANGTAAANASGGTPPYLYSWGNFGNSQTISNLRPGTYTVTIFDARQCSATGSVTITQPNPLTVSTSATPETAFNANNGTASATPSGGTAPYRHAWSNGGNTATINNLAPGLYTVTVTDANGCGIEGRAVVDPFDCGNFTATISGRDVSCNGGADGSAAVAPAAGTAPYTFAWNNGGNTATIGNLRPGVYSVTVTDANRCPVTLSVTIAQPPALSVTTSATPETAAGANNGSASASPSGGTPPYRYAWSNGGASATINNLAPGAYTVTITDANGCTVEGRAVVDPFDCGNFTATISGRDVSCHGQADGSAAATPAGGRPNYNFTWSNGASTAAINNLAPGAYSVTVVDARQCIVVRSVSISQPSALDLSVRATPASAPGVNDGSASASASGGVGGYRYAWSNGANGATIGNLAPSDYTVTVTDANNCMLSASVVVNAGQGGVLCQAQPVYAVSAPSSVCQGEAVELEADDLYPSSNVRYVWFIPTGDSITTILPRASVVARSAAYAGEYFCARDSLGCRSTRVGGAPVQVRSLPDDAAAVAAMDTVMCSPSDFALRAMPPLGGPGAWQSLDGAAIDAPDQPNTMARNLRPGANRFVWRVDLEGCDVAATDTLTAIVEAPPRVRDDTYTLQRAQDVLVMEVLLNDDLSGLADTLLIQESAPEVGTLELLENDRRFRYTVGEDFRGKVSFQYTVCNPSARCGLSCETATVTIEVLNLPAAPEGLIVDDPGPNGQLTIRGLRGFSRVEIQVFSRWGDLVFQEREYDNNNPWRGHAQRSGKPLPQGAYYYALRAFDGGVQIGDTQRGVIHLFEQRN